MSFYIVFFNIQPFDIKNIMFKKFFFEILNYSLYRNFFSKFDYS